jgi:hypothetical protein
VLARWPWLSLFALAACVRLNEDHCANQDAPDPYCVTKYDGGYCSRCEAKWDGCVEVLTDIDPDCRPDGATSVADDASTDDSTATTASSVSSTEDGSVTTSGPATSSTTDPMTGDESGTTGTVAECGNAMREGDEACDGTDLDEKDCGDFNLGKGVPECNEDCTFNFLPCDLEEDCGNGIIEGMEDCEEGNLGDATCESLPEFGGGDLSCDQMCHFNTSACTACLGALVACESDGQCCNNDCSGLGTCAAL